MLTEPSPELDDEERETPQGSSGFYGGRLLLTAALLALYLAGHVIGLPQVHPENLPFPTPVSLTLLVLGVAPLMVGFLLVEIFSLTTGPGRRLRTGGAAGRARLNRAALVTSLLLSAVQALAMARFLENVHTDLAPVVDEPGWLFRLLLVTTLTAVTAALFVLGNLLTDYGIGNGFALLLLAEIGWSAWWEGAAVRAEISEDTLPAALGIFVTVGLTALLVRFIRSAETSRTPPFPQGILPLQWTLAVLGFSWFFNLLGDRFLVGSFDLAILATPLVAVPLLAWLTFRLFSSRPRLETNLPETAEVVDHVGKILERRLHPSTALLALGTIALLAWNAWQPHSLLSTSFTFQDLVIAVMIVLDLLDQYRFLRRHGPVVRLIQLDNVHLSYRIAARLREEGIDVLARAQRMRSLLFFFGSLIKIDVLVPREQEDRAREVLSDLETAPQIIL